MICYNCGKALDADKKFCSECGTENIVTDEELAIDDEIAKRGYLNARQPLCCFKKYICLVFIRR